MDSLSSFSPTKNYLINCLNYILFQLIDCFMHAKSSDRVLNVENTAGD